MYYDTMCNLYQPSLFDKNDQRFLFRGLGRDEMGDIKPLELQDKRSAVVVEKGDWETWLQGTIDDAAALIQLPAINLLHHGPFEAREPVYLPGLPSSLWPYPERIETTEGLEAIAKMPQVQPALF